MNKIFFRKSLMHMKSLGIYYEKDSAKFAFNNQLWLFFFRCLTFTEIPTILFDIQEIKTDKIWLQNTFHHCLYLLSCETVFNFTFTIFLIVTIPTRERYSLKKSVRKLSVQLSCNIPVKFYVTSLTQKPMFIALK